MDTTTLSIEMPTVSLIDTLTEDLEALLGSAGLTTDDLEDLLSPYRRITTGNWIM